MDQLTKQDLIFVREVVKHGNQTEAARKAYGITSDDYARKKGSVMVAKGSISLAIEERKKSLADRFDNEEVLEVHRTNLFARKLDHMVFPLGPKEEDNQPDIADEQVNAIVQAQAELERTHLTDKDIEKLLNDANCVVRKIVHGRTARHVYFWAPDGMVRDKALDKVYKLKGAYAPEKSLNVNIDANIVSDERLEAIANTFNEAPRVPKESSEEGGNTASDGPSPDSVGGETPAQNQ